VKRVEGIAGDTGQILNLSAEQLQAIQAQDERVLYHFAGALNRTEPPPARATVVQCTNVHDTALTEIELQLFNFDATDVYTGASEVEPLHTVTFESSSVLFYSADVLMSTGHLEQGYGRILTEHDQVICMVQTVDPEGVPPAWSFDLPLYIGPFHSSFLPAIMNHTIP
jgi:hypothetical protein